MLFTIHTSSNRPHPHPEMTTVVIMQVKVVWRQQGFMITLFEPFRVRMRDLPRE